jgi:uncharacterized membrane protein YgcG
MGRSVKYGCLGCASLIVAAVVVVLLIAMVWAPSLGKRYAVDEARIRATVSADGALSVDERFTYTFHGDFTRVFRDIPIRPDAPIVVEGVTGPDGRLKRLPSSWTPASGPPVEADPGSDATPSPWSSIAPTQRPFGYYRVTTDWSTAEGPSLRIEAFAPLSDRSAAFTFRWRAAGAAVRYADTGELSWQLIGSGWDVPIERVRAAVDLPADTPYAEVRAWGHGPLNGMVRRDPDGAVVFAVDDLPPHTFVEAHLLFPGRVLADAPKDPARILASRLAEEESLAREANAQRARARAAAAAAKRLDRIAWAVGGTLAAAALTLWLVLFFRTGREYRPTFREKYLREVPEGVPPALAGALWRMGSVTDADLSATLLDLAVAGILRISPGSGGAFVLSLDRSRLGRADDLTQPLVRLLDEAIGSGSMTMDELRRWAAANAQRFRGGVDTWRDGVRQRARALGLVEKGWGGRAALAAAATGLAAILAAGLALLSWQWELLIPAAACIGFCVASPVMRRRSREAAELHARFKALDRYLRDFGRLHEKPAAAAVLWERYLVMAVVFGIATQVIEQMRIHVPQVTSDPEFTAVFWFTTPEFTQSVGGVSRAVSSFTTGVSTAVAAAAPPVVTSSGGDHHSSSSGGFSGGGFSGGGGRGGGGGGGGAD